jgi:hypothetical protein
MGNIMTLVNRIKMIPMPTEESSRQWFFDCEGLYIDVEHSNGGVSIYVRSRSDNKTGWKELIEKPDKELHQLKDCSKQQVKSIPIGFDYLDSGQLVATYAVPVASRIHPDLFAITQP